MLVTYKECLVICDQLNSTTIYVNTIVSFITNTKSRRDWFGWVLFFMHWGWEKTRSWWGREEISKFVLELEGINRETCSAIMLVNSKVHYDVIFDVIINFSHIPMRSNLITSIKKCIYHSLYPVPSILLIII